MEKLDTEIVVGDLLTIIEYDYPNIHLSMQCFWCQIVEGTPVLKEHEAARWLDPESIDSVDWLPADRTIIPTIAAALEKQPGLLADAIHIWRRTMPFQIIRNDITKVSADAIVNTANPEPVIGGGTDYAIHKAAGPELLEARKQIGNIYTGQSVATPAYQLSAKYVLHTVSPAWIDGQHHEEEDLRKAYDAALILAYELGCKSIAFPLMAAGTYGFPHDLALSVAIRAFTDFLLDHEMQIYLVLFNGKAFGIAGSIFDDLKSYIDDNYVAERSEEEYLIDEYPQANLSRRERARMVQRRRRKELKSIDWDGPVGAALPQQAILEEPKASAASLEDILRQHEKTFSEYLLDLLKERNGKDSEVYKRAEVSKQLFSKILNNPDYQPTKSTVIQLALGLQLDLPQTQKLLEKAGYALTRSSKTDLVVKYYIERKIYNVTFINEALYDCDLPLLKTGLKA